MKKILVKLVMMMVMMMVMMVMMVGGTAFAAPQKTTVVDTGIMSAFQQDIKANSRTRSSFIINGISAIDAEVLVVNMMTGQADLYRLTQVSDFEALFREQINCKDSRKPENYMVVLPDAAIAEAFVTTAQQVTQSSIDRKKGPVFKLLQNKNRLQNKPLDAFLADKGFDAKESVFIKLWCGKLVQRPIEKILDTSTKVNDFFSLPTTIKSSWNVLTNKGW